MPEVYTLCFRLLSAANFGRGDGLAGEVDREIEHDAYGLPIMRGRTLRGLLAEECANIRFSLRHLENAAVWERAGERLFGSPGSQQTDQGVLRVGDAHLPSTLVTAVRNENLAPDEVLRAFTAIRRQTSFNVHGAPESGSLRSLRLVLPDLTFESELLLAEEPSDLEFGLLTGCVMAWRRAGTGRNRGHGRLHAWLCNRAGDDVTAAGFAVLTQEVAR